ncbi:MAG: YdeI/OmpD-associated family protein [Dehalococcoidia bacterium]
MDNNNVLFFGKSSEWRRWLEENYDNSQELWVGFYKKGSGIPSITWPESVDEALCFGWIDGVRKSIDEASYKIRFTPRKRGSIWSTVNVRRVQELTELGLMKEAGLRAFNGRDTKKTKLYQYENKPVELSDQYERQFRNNEKAWNLFQSQAPSYKRVCTWWVMSAKQEATRQRRLATLIEDSAAGRRSASFRRSTKPT